MSAIVGSLACQRNSFLKSLKTTVISCQIYKQLSPNEKKDKGQNDEDTNGKYAIEFSDTILFPEGGGQPYDFGTITMTDSEDIPVEMVLRDKLKALHIVPKPLEPGTAVSLNVDWERRLDHMQQHTGQHLISAVFDTYGIETLSWSLGKRLCYIELPKKISSEILNEVSNKINGLIFEGIPIKVVTAEEHDGEVDTSHIPEDYDKSQGTLRVVKIGDLDANPCCGTHLRSTSQIQAVALLHQVGIRGGNSRLHFVCGNRVYKEFESLHALSKDIAGGVLSCQIEDIPEKVTSLNANYKKSVSSEQSLLKEIACIEAQRILGLFNAKDVTTAFCYRPDNRNEYWSLFQKELSTLSKKSEFTTIDFNSRNTIVMINGKQGNEGGMVKVMGPKAQEIAGELKKLIKGIKGGGKGTSFQGKVVTYEKGEIESVLHYLKALE